MGKTADELSGIKYPAGGGNDINIYKQPQTVTVDDTTHSEGNKLNETRISLGNVTKGYAPENPFGKKEMRGYGAATKGRKISGKQG